MCYLYLTDHNAKVGINGGFVTVNSGETACNRIPQEMVDGISIYGNAGITTQALHYFMQQGIPVGFFTQHGNYLGSTNNANAVNASRLRKQVHLSEDARFALSVSKVLVTAKVKNQVALLKRQGANSHAIGMLELYADMARRTKGIPALMGVEGSASREYFGAWPSMISEEWGFVGRNRRPSKDPVNAMLNLGYSLLHKEVLGILSENGLCAYIGFLHSDRVGHAALASDIMEEWRPVIVDSTVLEVIQSGRIQMEHFHSEGKECTMTLDGIKLFVAAIEQKMHEQRSYLADIQKMLSFREALWHQVRKLCSVVDNRDIMEYASICG